MIKTITISITALIIVSCGVSKRNPAPSIIPTEVQLAAIQAKFPETTMQNLTNGHTLYIGVCTDCHKKKSIYRRSEEKWVHIVDEMAKKAKINKVQEDDLYKYVLSMKLTQPIEKK